MKLEFNDFPLVIDGWVKTRPGFFNGNFAKKNMKTISLKGVECPIFGINKGAVNHGFELKKIHEF